jgi:hypothetical protein
MRHFFAMALAAALWMAPAPAARAQYGVIAPGYGYGVTYGYGMPYGYGFSSGYGYGGYGYGLPYPGGYALSFGYAPGLPYAGANFYGSGYSGYLAPGITTFYSGYGGPYYGGGGYGLGGLGYGYGYRGLRSSGYVATGPFMGLPRPFGGLRRVPR